MNGWESRFCVTGRAGARLSRPFGHREAVMPRVVLFYHYYTIMQVLKNVFHSRAMSVANFANQPSVGQKTVESLFGDPAENGETVLFGDES